MKISRYIPFLMLLLGVLFTSCDDVIPYDPVVIGDGESALSAEVEFRSLEPALNSRAAGNAVETINQLWVVLYKVNADGTETGDYEKVLLYDEKTNYKIDSDFTIDQTGNTAYPGDAETVTPSENDPTDIGPSDEVQKTPKAKFKLKNIPYGRYKMFAVANVDLTDVDCSTIAKLRGTRFSWDTDVSKDNQMFGYFTTSGSPTSLGDAPVLIINDKTVSLHSWVRRLVSKVTVSFDASQLNESVRIYIKSVTIRDIPKTCPMGEDNTPTDTLQLIPYGESFTYYNAGEGDNAQHEKWKMVLSRGSGPQGEVDHTEGDPALYFFENMQGNYEGQDKYNKQQDPNAVGTAVDLYGQPDYKDDQICGTYIEVEAYYDSRNKDKISQGPIKYRFMLGKNTTFNYNAERNYHYKLTLKFRGWANEADWHISYKEYKRTLITPEPYYISYLYNQQMDFPARVVLFPGDNPADFRIKAEIVENNWWPWDRDANDGKGARPAEFVPSGLAGMQDINGFAWNVGAYNNVYKHVPYTPETYTPNMPYEGSNYVGFLSLRPNTGDIIGTNSEILALLPSGTKLDTYGYGSTADNYLKEYYQQHNLAVNTYPLTMAPLDNVDNSVSMKIPMYTRNKEMVPSTDFTGNNPFNSYSRYAKVRFTLEQNKGGKWEQIGFLNEDGKEETERVATIYQVPRIENPKAIYRDWDKDDNFFVQLMILPNAGTSTYKPFRSDGPWRASIMCQTESFITLSDKNNTKTVSSIGDYIEGSTDNFVEFNYKPSSKLSSPNETRCGIIKVEYNDYNCVHLIIVRQGYHKGVKLGNATWSCYNVYATSRGGNYRDSYAPGTETSVEVALTRSPLSVGSFLKRNQYNYSIREENNTTYGWLKPISYKNGESNVVYYELSTAYVDASGNTKNRGATWGVIQGFGWTNFGSNATLDHRTTRKWADTWTAVGNFQKGVKFAVPTGADFISMRDNCKFGYGIVYADGATITQEDFSVANGYTDYNNSGAHSIKGVRACVVYDENDGKNVIFPLSALGQARRSLSAPSAVSSWGTIPFSDPLRGSLTYGGMRMVLGGSSNEHRPLTYNLYRSPGAIYWVRQPVMTNENAGNLGIKKPDYASWDINYFTLVFNPYDTNSLSGWNKDTNKYDKSGVDAASCSDALPIKLIYK